MKTKCLDFFSENYVIDFENLKEQLDVKQCDLSIKIKHRSIREVYN